MRFLVIAIALGMTVGQLTAQSTVVFKKANMVDAKGKKTQVDLYLDAKTGTIATRAADTDIVRVPYSAIEEISYDYNKKRRVKEGALLMIASLGVGGVVMLTKSKSHWLYIDYKEGDKEEEFVVQMHKKNYKDISTTLQDQTGKEVKYSRR